MRRVCFAAIAAVFLMTGAQATRADDFDLDGFRVFWGDFRARSLELAAARRAEGPEAAKKAAVAQKKLEELVDFPITRAQEGGDWMTPGGPARTLDSADFASQWKKKTGETIQTGQAEAPTLLERIKDESEFDYGQWENCQKTWSLWEGFCGEGDKARFESLRFTHLEGGWKLTGFVEAGADSADAGQTQSAGFWSRLLRPAKNPQ